MRLKSTKSTQSRIHLTVKKKKLIGLTNPDIDFWSPKSFIQLFIVLFKSREKSHDQQTIETSGV